MECQFCEDKTELNLEQIILLEIYWKFSELNWITAYLFNKSETQRNITNVKVN